MFVTTILFCFFQYGEIHCLTAEDSRGPYLTMRECEERAAEMADAVRSMNPTTSVRGYKCDKVEGEKT